MPYDSPVDICSPKAAGFGTGLPDAYGGAPGTICALHLVVADIDAARVELMRRDVEVGEVQDVGGG